MTRKLLVFAGVMVLGVSSVMAASITVPFFFDREDVTITGGASLPPTTGAMTFIGLFNQGTNDLVIQVTYVDSNGLDVTEAGSNTFELLAGTSITWRPRATDPNVEGAGAAIIDSTSRAAGALLEWVGVGSDLVGRVQEFRADGGISAWLMPAGKD